MYLLDTNVVSAFSRPTVDPAVAAFFERHQANGFQLSVITIGEIRYGIELLPEGQRKADLMIWLVRWLLPTFRDRIIRVDREIANAWGRLAARAKRLGLAPEVPDVQIAATAEVRRLRIVTRNVADFEPFGLDVIDPWREGGGETPAAPRKDTPP